MHAYTVFRNTRIVRMLSRVILTVLLIDNGRMSQIKEIFMKAYSDNNLIINDISNILISLQMPYNLFMCRDSFLSNLHSYLFIYFITNVFFLY